MQQHRSQELQEAQLSPSDRAMRLVSSNLANYHATVQKRKQDPSSDHTGEDPSKDRNGNCR